MTYNVFNGKLNPAQSTQVNLSYLVPLHFQLHLFQQLHCQDLV